MGLFDVADLSDTSRFEKAGSLAERNDPQNTSVDHASASEAKCNVSLSSAPV